MRFHPIAGAAVALAVHGASFAAPPPPPPQGAIERASRIIAAPAADGIQDYVHQFAENVRVYENDTLVASGKAEWAAYLCAHAGLHIRILHVSYGNPIVAVEAISNISYRGPGIIQDCCFWSRVSAYHLDEHGRIDQVRFLLSGTYWGRPERPE